MRAPHADFGAGCALTGTPQTGMGSDPGWPCGVEADSTTTRRYTGHQLSDAFPRRRAPHADFRADVRGQEPRKPAGVGPRMGSDPGWPCGVEAESTTTHRYTGHQLSDAFPRRRAPHVDFRAGYARTATPQTGRGRTPHGVRPRLAVRGRSRQHHDSPTHRPSATGCFPPQFGAQYSVLATSRTAFSSKAAPGERMWPSTVMMP